SIAWRLARNQRRVLILDTSKIGSEASSAAAGMLTPGGEFEQPSAALHFALRSLAKYDDFIGALQADSGLPIEFRHTTAVQIALTSAELQSLTDRAASQRPAGIPSADLSWGELRALVPLVSPDAIGAIQYLNEATVEPVSLMAALRAACLARGVSIQEHSPVQSICASTEGVQLSLTGQIFKAPFAVLAAGAWSSNVPVNIDSQPYALPRSFPIKGHLLGYRLAAGSLAATIRHHHTYIFQRAGGFTIVGSSTEDVGYDRTIDPEIVSDIAARAGALVPGLASLAPESVWIGFRPGVDSPVPHIGRVGSSRLWLAYGHYRNGILLAPATCDQVCQEIAAALH
ncbi:MAG: FAD-dependent oxidoreductase, partial [Bryobacterales bacterium]|nr:FAD-dependent oxidoreductase [Bryobacterales bacterium]